MSQNIPFMGQKDTGSVRTFIQAATEKVTAQAYKRLYEEARDAAHWWKQFFVDEGDAPKSGHWYWNPRTRKMYQASRKGEYPARKTGNMLEKMLITVSPYNPKQKFIRISFFSKAPYTKDLIDMQRKFVAESKNELYDYIQSNLARGIKHSSGQDYRSPDKIGNI